MSNRVPETTAKKIKEIVYQEADKFNYLARTRTDNSRFLARLVAMHDVGDVLSSFMKKSEIRTYIKDAILNRYSKDKKNDERPDSLLEKSKSLFNISDLVENEKDGGITLFKSEHSPAYVVVAEGTYLKWETALRKALIYIASKPFGKNTQNSIHIILSLFARHTKIPESDKNLLGHSLARIPAKVVFWGE